MRAFAGTLAAVSIYICKCESLWHYAVVLILISFHGKKKQNKELSAFFFFCVNNPSSLNVYLFYVWNNANYSECYESYEKHRAWKTGSFCGFGVLSKVSQPISPE